MPEAGTTPGHDMQASPPRSPLPESTPSSILIVRAAQVFLGEAGIYAAAALSGLVDVDAPTIALSRLGPGANGWGGPALAITAAAVTNNVMKLGFAVALGSGSFRARVALSLTAMSLAGVVVAVIARVGL